MDSNGTCPAWPRGPHVSSYDPEGRPPAGVRASNFIPWQDRKSAC